MQATFNASSQREPRVVEASGNIDSTLAEESIQASVGLRAFFSDIEMVYLTWTLTPDFEAVLRDDPWVQSNYLAAGYSLSFFAELCNGGITIPDVVSIKLGGSAPDAGYKPPLSMCKLRGEAVDPSAFYAFHTQWDLVGLLQRDASGVITDNVFLLQQEQDPWLIDMKMTLAQYAEYALCVRGVRGWQRAYLDRKDPAFARMMHVLPKIFPGERFDDVFAR